MDVDFFTQPILNSPYAAPRRHWELVEGQPTNRIIETRRRCDLISPVPPSKKRRAGKARQSEMILGGKENLSTEEVEYTTTAIVL